MKKIIIKHVDGKTYVKANVLIFGESINLEYKFQGMTYGRELTLLEAYKLGIIKDESQKEIERMSNNYSSGNGFI